MAASTQMNTFEPSSDLIQEEDCDTILLYLPGFAKEQLRVQLSKSGFLKVTGTRPMKENEWSSFQKDFEVPQNCDTTKISAKFEGGILYIRQPKLVVPAQENVSSLRTQETAEHKPTGEPKATRNDHEQLNAHKTENAPNTPKELPEKLVHEEMKSHNEERKSSNKNDEEKNIDEISKKNDDIGKVDGHKLAMESLLGKVKRGRKIVNMVLVVLVAFGVGMYVNNLIWCSSSNELKNGSLL